MYAVKPHTRSFAVLAAIAEFWREHGYAPSYRELMTVLDISTPSQVVYHLQNLEINGYIERVVRKSRTLRLTRAGRRVLVQGQTP